MPRRDGSLNAREFLFFAEDQAMAVLPAELPRPERRVMWTILQLHWGNPAVHFELQPQPSRRVVELGLHFEGPVEANDAWAAHIGHHARDLLCALGPAWELEEWTTTWRRLHRTYPFETLTEALGREVGDELVRAIVALHPLIESGPVVAVRALSPRSSPGRRR